MWFTAFVKHVFVISLRREIMKHKNLVILAMVVSMITFAALGGRSDEGSSISNDKAAIESSAVETQLPLAMAVGD